MPSRRSGTPRLQDPLSFERAFWSRGLVRIAGVDEVGRGPLAGPVVAAAVVLPQDILIPGADDSKCLSAEQRTRLATAIRERALAVGIGSASVHEIDRLNIRVATSQAMKRAVARLTVAPDHLLVDGLPVRELDRDAHTAVIDGDRLVHSIACASILAKVVRDHLMLRLATRYPAYGWERNKGYGTREHLHALARYGPTPHHRRSFRPVVQLGLGC
jgi:ribonuclease HII